MSKCRILNGLEQLIEGPIRDELVAPAQRGDHALAHVTVLAAGFDDLEILARVRPAATTLHAHEHAAIIERTRWNGKKKTRG
jgi:hypothetical protein